MRVALGFAVFAVAMAAATAVVIDLQRRPDWVFVEARQSRLAWIVTVLLLSALCGVIGLGVSAFYFLRSRPRLEEIARTGPSGPVGDG